MLTIEAIEAITELGFVRVGRGKAAYAQSVDAGHNDVERTL